MNWSRLLSLKLFFFVLLNLASSEFSLAKSRNGKNESGLKAVSPDQDVTIFIAEIDKSKQTRRQKVQIFFNSFSFLPRPNDLKWSQYFDLKPKVVKFRELKFDRMLCYSPENIIIILNRPIGETLKFCLPKSKYDLSQQIILTSKTLKEMKIQTSSAVSGSLMVEAYTKDKSYDQLVKEDALKPY